MEFRTVLILISFSFLMFSCIPSEQNNNENLSVDTTAGEVADRSAAIENVETVDINDDEPLESMDESSEVPLFEEAIVSVGGLSLRDRPNIESHILRLLEAGTRLEILDRTDSPVEIGGMTDYWYQVKLDTTYTMGGWVFGGYIVESNGPDVIEKTYFTDHEAIDHGIFPNSEMKIFGIDVPYEIPQDGNPVGYDAMNSILFVQFESDQTPPDNAWIEAISPSGEIFRHNQPLVIMTMDHWTEELIDPPYIGFRFFDLSSFPDGPWQFRLSSDGEEILSFQHFLSPRDLTISTMRTPDPFTNNGSATFEKYETAYISGNLEAERDYSLVVYQQMDEPQGDPGFPDFPLIPVLATSVTTDDQGLFLLELNLGDDFPQGYFELGIGIEDIEIITFNLGFHYDKGEQVFRASDR